MSLTIGVDVGGTKIAAGVVNKNGKILARVRKATPAHDPEASINTIIEIINELKANHEISAVGVGAPGFVDSGRTSVIFAPNVNWRNEPLAVKLSSQTGLPVIVENDANAAAWGEFKFGAAAAKRSAIIVTVGTGIGGGIVIDGKLQRGTYGFGAEIGHINMVQNGTPCGCGQNGCWEAYASGTALVRYARERAAAEPEKATKLLALAGQASEINGLQITEAAKDGCEVALSCFAEIGFWIGQGMANLATILDPECFVISGGVSEAGALLLDPVVQSFHQKLIAKDYRPVPTVNLANLGNDAGMIGVANLARKI